MSTLTIEHANDADDYNDRYLFRSARMLASRAAFASVQVAEASHLGGSTAQGTLVAMQRVAAAVAALRTTQLECAHDEQLPGPFRLTDGQRRIVIRSIYACAAFLRATSGDHGEDDDGEVEYLYALTQAN